MHLTQKQVVMLIAAVVVVLVLGTVIYFVTKKPTVGPAVTLNVWGTDDATAMNDLGAAYTGLRPNVTVKYTQIDAADYETKLYQAFAAGDGPDVFEIGDHDLPRWESALAPLPTSTYAATFNLATIGELFPNVVTSDFTTPQGAIYGLPLSIDTLAMFYNEADFDSAGIAVPPATWDAFDADIATLRQTDAQGNITRAAVALGGTTASYAHADDMLYLLMLQNGVQMISPDESSASFEDGGPQAEAAVNFYLQFSNANSPYYTWNDSMGNALQSFASGSSTVYFGYYADLAAIKAAAPFLNVGVAPMPQPSGASVSINYPNYEGLVVAKTGDTAYGWDFILSTAGGAAGENLYVKDASVPAAQRTAIASQESDPTLGVFAKQALSAESWYEADDQQIDAAFTSMLQNIQSGAESVPTALQNTEATVTGIMRQK